ncbi:hypothetical protein Tco_0163593 [Tanacetum coccineum]
MSQDQSIPRRNKVDWHMANDDPILTTMRFIPQHKVVQKCGAILPDNLTTQAMKESEAYKTYYAFATGKAIHKAKYVRRSTKEKPEQAPEASFDKRLKAIAKVTKSGKKKQPAKGLETLSEIALSEAEQMKLAIERRKIQLHSSQPSSSGAYKGTGKDEDDNDQDDDEQTESDNDGDDFVHPKLSTHDDEARNDDEVNEEESNEESNDESNEESDEEVQGTNTEEEEMDEEATHEEDEANELYRDVNVNLEGRDTMMTDAPLPNVQATPETEDTHVILTAPINPEDMSIDSKSTLNTEATSLVDVPVTTIPKPPFVSATTLPPPPTPLITHMQKIPVPTPTTIPSTSLQDLPKFGSLFGFDHRLKTLETDFFEFKQTNQFAEVVSSIPGIVNAYLANKMHEAIKTVVQLQPERLRDEAQAENKNFLNKLDDNIKKIIKDQVKEQVKAQVSKILPKIEKTVNEQLEAEVMTRSSTESKTSLAIAANLSELEIKKILIDKMESNKSIHRSDEQRISTRHWLKLTKVTSSFLTLMVILSCLKDEEMMRIKIKNPLLDQTGGPREDELEKNMSQPIHQRKRHPSQLVSQLKGPNLFTSLMASLLIQRSQYTPPRIWKNSHIRSSKLELLKINLLMRPLSLPSGFRNPLDFHLSIMIGIRLCLLIMDQFNLTFMMNWLKVDTLTPELLAGPTFELMKGTCKSLVKLEYLFEEVYKATTDQLDWNNPEGQQYPHDLRKPLPLILNSHGRQVIPFDQFINNDLAYLSGGVSSQTYATSVTKTKAADYGHIKWIEYLVPNIMWSEVPLNYDKHALWGISHWGRKCQQFYGFAANRESAHDVYYKRRIIAVTKL